MARYTIDEVGIEGSYRVSKIQELSMDIGVNRHGALTYGGLVPEEDAARIVQQSADKQIVKVYLHGELEFCGYPQEIITEHHNEHCYLRVTLVTGSQQTDIYPRNRFYQDTDKTFADVVTEAYEDSGTGNLVAVRGKEKIVKPILQYRETDWAFTLRMAGKLGTIIIPNVVSAEPQISLGIPKRNATVENNSISYTVSRNPLIYNQKDAADSRVSGRSIGCQTIGHGHYKDNGRDKYTLFDKLSYQNFLRYEMKSEKRYKLGDGISIDGKILTIMEKRFTFERGEIQELYFLGHEQDYAVAFHHNKHTAGLELEGKVLKRQGQEMQLLLNIDANRAECKKTWFSYSPVTNNGMYSMPLEGEKVMLQWQSELDHDVLVVRPDRKNGAGMPPPERHFLDENENHLMMVSGKVEYVNPVGCMKWLASEGFDISTGKNVDIYAGKDLAIKSQGQVRGFSPERITACKAGVESSVDMIGNELHIKAVKKVLAKSKANIYKKTKLPKLDKKMKINDSTAEKLVASIPHR